MVAHESRGAVRTKMRCVIACVALWLVSVWRGDRALIVWLSVVWSWLGYSCLVLY